MSIPAEKSYFITSSSFINDQYTIILTFLVFSIALTVVILLASYNFAIQNPESEKLSAYECGFEPYEDARNVVDIKFYVVGILFMIFDIEILYVIPWSISLSKLNLLGFWSMMEFILELSVGFFYVYLSESLTWD